MFPASTNAGGMCSLPGPTNVCKTPSPAGPVPMPYPSMGQLAMANPGTCSMKVMILMKQACTVSTQIPMSSGDEAGVAGGVVSGMNMGPVGYMMGSTKVMVEGNPMVMQMSTTMHNGSSANMPMGMQAAPSQAKVLSSP